MSEEKQKNSPQSLVELASSIGKVIIGKDEVISLILTALFAGGHVLIEDIPGVGKTTLAHALARSIDCSFRRIQFTSDLLPSDILGTKVYDPASGGFEFMPGPIFNSVILADEINRTTPRTQSALLEAMNENQVTMEGDTHALPEPFMVIATQNPLEHYGTYPLPDSQLDRFMMSISMGYPDSSDERRILGGASTDPFSNDFRPVMANEEISYWQTRVDEVKMESEIVDYIISIVERTRNHRDLRLGASPRGSLALVQAAKSWALLKGRNYCLPDDVKYLAGPVLSHRLLVGGQATLEQRRRAALEILEEILDEVSVPV